MAPEGPRKKHELFERRDKESINPRDLQAAIDAQSSCKTAELMSTWFSAV